MASIVRESDEELKAKKMEELKNETIPFYLEKLDAMAAENNGYLALGQVNKITIALATEICIHGFKFSEFFFSSSSTAYMG